MKEEELKALEKLCAEATPGPWDANERSPCKADGVQVWSEAGLIGETAPAVIDQRRPASDADFIAAARTALPQLLSEVRKLMTALALVEWGSCDGCGNKHHCVECRGGRPPDGYELWPEEKDYYGHKPGCPVAAALGYGA